MPLCAESAVITLGGAVNALVPHPGKPEIGVTSPGFVVASSLSCTPPLKVTHAGGGGDSGGAGGGGEGGGGVSSAHDDTILGGGPASKPSLHSKFGPK